MFATTILDTEEAMLDSVLLQLIFLVFITCLCAYLASRRSFTFRKSLNFLIDPGTFAGESETMDKKQFGVGILLTLIGLLTLGGIISVLNNALSDYLYRAKLQRIEERLDGAFEIPSYSYKARQYIKKHDLISSSRGYTMEDLEFELEIYRKDILDSINMLHGFRVRQEFKHKYIAVEQLYSNRSYGTLLQRNNPITVVCTLPLSARYIGHFSHILAQNTDANYISNDFFDGGHLDTERRMSFTIHTANQTLSNSQNPAHNEFLQDLNALNQRTKQFVYIGYTRNESHALEVFCADNGAKSDAENHCSRIDRFTEHLDALEKRLRSHGHPPLLREADSIDNPIHIANAIHMRFNKPTVLILVPLDVLLQESELDYYIFLKEVRDFVRDITHDESETKR
ncbi:MAG: hypothetical protein VX278_23185 [Myxococcota bacterium]|nr:hypothetical protein [Myxococcota bacterium]